MQRLKTWFSALFSQQAPFAWVCALAVFSLPQVSWGQGFPQYTPQPSSGSFPADAAPASGAPGLFPATQPTATQPAAKPSGAAAPAGNRFPSAGAVEVKTVSFPTEESASASEAQPLGRPLSYAELGEALKALKLDVNSIDGRHDFLYRAELEEQQVELFFTIELTEESSQIRVRTWLDPLPTSVVSEEPLLKLLARNTRLKQGMHYAFNLEIRRFLLETVIDNESVTPGQLTTALNDVSREVASSFALWSTVEWGTGPKRIATQPELDSRAGDISGERFELPVRR